MARGLSSHPPPAPHHRPHCKLGPQGHSLRAGGALSSRGARQRRGRGRVSVQSLSHLPLSKELSALPTVRTTLNRWVNVTTSMGSERTETRGTMATRRNGGVSVATRTLGPTRSHLTTQLFTDVCDCDAYKILTGSLKTSGSS